VARLAGPARFADLLIFDESDLPAALTKLETATLPGFERSRLLRGYALHRRYPITSKPLPPRAMLLMTLHPMDSTTYKPADIEPYVIRPVSDELPAWVSTFQAGRVRDRTRPRNRCSGLPRGRAGRGYLCIALATT
jgi:hypothetical protein